MTGLFVRFQQKIIPILALFMLGMLLDFALGAGLGQVALAQSPITAQADRTTLAVDEQLVLTVTVNGDFLRIPRPDLSQLQDFVVVSSSTSTQVSIVNGKMTSQGVFIYRLQPLGEGKLVIGPVSVNMDGQVFQTDPIEIEVVASGTQVTPPDQEVPGTDTPDTFQGQDFFVEAEVDDPTPYLGQQIIYTFRLYQAINFFGQPDYQPPAFTDFWSSEGLSQPQYNTETRGRQYLVTEIRTALFPANLGPITIEPASLEIPGGLLKPDIKLETEPITVEVRPLPEGEPAGFSGAVGQFEIRAELSPVEGKVNEPIELVVEIEGTGNIETLTGPALPELPGWRVFESQASTTIETGEEAVRGVRSFERLIVPGRAGEQTFPAISFSYYDPRAEAYRSVNTDPIPVTIQPAELEAPPVVVGTGAEKQPVELIAADIRHIKPAPTSLDIAGDSSGVGRVIYWSGWILPAFFIGTALIWQNRRQRLQQDTVYARSLRARRVAFKVLADAQRYGQDGYAAASGRALHGYLSDKLNQPTAGLTTDDLVTLLRKSGLKAALIERVHFVLNQVDIGRFAPVSEGAGQSIIAETRRLINALEKSFGRRRR